MHTLMLWAALLAPDPAGWVPARWPWTEARTLELVAGTPVNCLLMERATPEFAKAASAKGIATLAVVRPGGDTQEAVRRALSQGVSGVVLEGDFPAGTAARVGAAVELAPRVHMALGGPSPVVGTYQGIWPGVRVTSGGAAVAAPTGSPWIDTNSGFVRATRAWGEAAVWLANLPPEKTVLRPEQYLQAIADAALAGGHWVLALDSDFAARLEKREDKAMAGWKRMMSLLGFLDAHRDWRSLRPYGRLAVVQDPVSGALVSGGILDMIAARHTPVRAVPASRLTPETLRDTKIALDVDADSLNPSQQEVLKGFARSGGTLLTPAPGPPLRPGERVTLDDAETARLGDIFHDVQGMIGRRNLGVRLFNVSSMLSNLLVSPDGKALYLHLVNYSGYPAENITVQLLGKFNHARLIAPEGEKDLEVYPSEDGTGVDVPGISIWATLRLD
jgi:hypothetical protein